MALDRLARLERLYDGPIPAPLRRWALSGMPPAPPRLQADPGATDTQAPDPWPLAPAVAGQADIGQMVAGQVVTGGAVTD